MVPKIEIGETVLPWSRSYDFKKPSNKTETKKKRGQHKKRLEKTTNVAYSKTKSFTLFFTLFELKKKEIYGKTCKNRSQFI